MQRGWLCGLIVCAVLFADGLTASAQQYGYSYSYYNPRTGKSCSQSWSLGNGSFSSGFGYSNGNRGYSTSGGYNRHGTWSHSSYGNSRYGYSQGYYIGR